jgi:hypothetical protein
MDFESGQVVLHWFFKVCFILIALSIVGKNLTRFDSRFRRMTLGVGISLVVVFSTALAYLEIPGRYYFPIILVSSVCLHIIQSKGAFSFRPLCMSLANQLHLLKMRLTTRQSRAALELRSHYLVI